MSLVGGARGGRAAVVQSDSWPFRTPTEQKLVTCIGSVSCECRGLDRQIQRIAVVVTGLI